MALTEPYDLLSAFPGWVNSFEPMRRQERSRSAGGKTYVKDLGSPLWTLSATSKLLKPNQLDYWRARLESMENGLKTFIGYSLSRTYPILYPNGSWPTGNLFDGESAYLFDVGANRKSVRIAGLPAAFKFSVGDMFSFGYNLHRVQEEATASGGGTTPFFEVSPHIWPGFEGSESPPYDVSVYRPSCIMSIEPGSISSPADNTGWGTISFRGVEAR